MAILELLGCPVSGVIFEGPEVDRESNFHLVLREILNWSFQDFVGNPRTLSDTGFSEDCVQTWRFVQNNCCFEFLAVSVATVTLELFGDYEINNTTKKHDENHVRLKN